MITILCACQLPSLKPDFFLSPESLLPTPINHSPRRWEFNPRKLEKFWTYAYTNFCRILDTKTMFHTLDLLTVAIHGIRNACLCIMRRTVEKWTYYPRSGENCHKQLLSSWNTAYALLPLLHPWCGRLHFSTLHGGVILRCNVHGNAYNIAAKVSAAMYPWTCTSILTADRPGGNYLRQYPYSVTIFLL